MNSIFACKNMFSLCATEDGQGKVSTRFSYSICNSNFSIYKPGLARVAKQINTVVIPI